MKKPKLLKNSSNSNRRVSVFFKHDVKHDVRDRDSRSILKFEIIENNWLHFSKKATKSFLYYGTGSGSTGPKSLFSAFSL